MLFARAKKSIHRKFAPYHQKLSQYLSFYRKWHQFKYHRQIHYFAALCGLILAIYFIMIDEILSQIIT